MSILGPHASRRLKVARAAATFVRPISLACRRKSSSASGRPSKRTDSMRSFLCCLALAAALMPLAALAQNSPESSKDAVSENATKAATFAAAEALRYELRPADKPKETLKLVSQPVLRWSNPTNGEVHGSVVLWTNHGCPEAAASIYQFFNR